MSQIETCGYAFIASDRGPKLVTRATVAHSSEGDVAVKFGDKPGAEVTVYLPAEDWQAIGEAAAKLASHKTGYGRCPTCDAEAGLEQDRTH